MILDWCCSRLGTRSRGGGSVVNYPCFPHSTGEGIEVWVGRGDPKNLTLSQTGQHDRHNNYITAGGGASLPPRLIPTTQQAGAGSATVQMGPGVAGGRRDKQNSPRCKCRSSHQVALDHRSASQPSSAQARPPDGPQLTARRGRQMRGLKGLCHTLPHPNLSICGRATGHPLHSSFFPHCTCSLSLPVRKPLPEPCLPPFPVTGRPTPSEDEQMPLPAPAPPRRAADPHPSPPQGVTKSPGPESNIWRHQPLDGSILALSEV